MLILKRRHRRPGLARDRRIAAAAAALCAWVGASSPARADDDMLVIPALRLALGPAVHVDPALEEGVEAAFDVTAGFAGIFGDGVSGFVVNPEVGYAYDSLGIHAFSATCGVGVGGPVVALLYHPRLILGSADGNFAVGMRNGLAVHALADILSLEIAHQLVDANDEAHHDVRVQFGINVAGFGWVISQLDRAFR